MVEFEPSLTGCLVLAPQAEQQRGTLRITFRNSEIGVATRDIDNR